MAALLDLPAPMNTFSSLRQFYDETETYIRGLDSSGQCEDTYGSMLVPVMFQKLPAEVKKTMTREHDSSSWRLSDIRRILLKELTIMEAGNDLQLSSFQTTAAFVTNSSRQRNDYQRKGDSTRESNFSSLKNSKYCVFCKNSSHYSTDCQRITDYESRIEIVRRYKLCFNCLWNHRVSDCK